MIDRFSGEYEFLSNFYPSEVEYKGIKFPTVEHAKKDYIERSMDKYHGIRL